MWSLVSIDAMLARAASFWGVTSGYSTETWILPRAFDVLYREVLTTKDDPLPLVPTLGVLKILVSIRRQKAPEPCGTWLGGVAHAP